MEEDKLKDLFADFEPELSSDLMFLTKLQHNLERVEMIRQHNQRVASMRKKAVAIAAAIGFIAGFLFSTVVPYIGKAMIGLRSSLPASSMIADSHVTIAWLFISGITAIISINTYHLSLSLLKQRHP